MHVKSECDQRTFKNKCLLDQNRTKKAHSLTQTLVLLDHERKELVF